MLPPAAKYVFYVNWIVPVSIGVGTLPSAKTVDARIDLAKMAKKWSSSKTIMQNDTYRVPPLRLVVWTLTLPQVRKAPGIPRAGVPEVVYDEYLSTAPHGVSVYSLRILAFAPGCHTKPTFLRFLSTTTNITGIALNGIIDTVRNQLQQINFSGMLNT